MLHLKGFDHETDSGQMARRERALRKAYALPQGLIQRAVQTRPAGQAASSKPRMQKAAQKAQITAMRAPGQ
jgi:probable rRNA maturation factor